MQPFQVAKGVKQVNGNPVKDGFQCHEQFAQKIYMACNRSMLQMLTSSAYFDALETMTFTSKSTRLRWIVQRYRDYGTSWEQSNHKPSQMVALFLKSMQHYLRCNHAIEKFDPWHLEIESTKLLLLWRMFGKTTYMRLQCKYMERFYNNELL